MIIIFPKLFEGIKLDDNKEKEKEDKEENNDNANDKN